MADDHALQERLAKLSNMLGKKFTLVEPPHDSEPDAEESTVPDPLQWQRDMAPKPEEVDNPTEEPKQEDEDAPKRFFEHDAGPRAQVEGAFDNSRFTIGEPIEASAEFCPWKVVTAYPNAFVGNTNRPHVEPYFEKIFKGRVWDFFYLYHPTTPAEKPYLFVPTSQFQCFLDTINRALGVALCIPAGPPSERFFIRFGEGGTPRPRYFRRLTDEALDEPLHWPDISIKDSEQFNAASGICQGVMLETISLVKTPPSKDKKGKHKKSERKRAERQYMLEETQTLLGLEDSHPLREIKGEDNVVFVSVDVEAIERPPNPISEIGFAVLDMRDIKDIAHGPCGKEWHSKITAHHLRTKEYSGLINHQFIQGCPDFFDFGKSTFPSEEKLTEATLAVLQPYIDTGRDMVLVGHDIKQDIQYLLSIGVDLDQMTGIRRTLDTQAIHQAWKQADNGRGLSGVLGDLGLVGTNLHNAGNDAVYTLHALIGVAIENLRQRKIEAEGGEYKPELWTM